MSNAAVQSLHFPYITTHFTSKLIGDSFECLTQQRHARCTIDCVYTPSRRTHRKVPAPSRGERLKSIQLGPLSGYRVASPSSVTKMKTCVGKYGLCVCATRGVHHRTAAHASRLVWTTLAHRPLFRARISELLITSIWRGEPTACNFRVPQ